MNLNPAHLYSSLTVNTAVGDLHTCTGTPLNCRGRPSQVLERLIQSTSGSLMTLVTDYATNLDLEMLGDDLSGHAWPHGIHES